MSGPFNNVGAIIGAGIYVVTGIAAGLAGPTMIVSMVLEALVALFTALSFAELSSWLPPEGSVYVFSYRLISSFAGFLSGWMYMLGNVFAGTSVSFGFANYFINSGSMHIEGHSDKIAWRTPSPFFGQKTLALYFLSPLS